MSTKLLGYEVPRQRDLVVPSDAMVKPIYSVNNAPLLPFVTDHGVDSLPFVSGSAPKNPFEGGFVPATNMPRNDAEDEPDFAKVLAGMMGQVGPQAASDWLGKAATQSIVAGGCTGVMDKALESLGVANPLASGPLASVLGNALQKAGVGELTSLLPSLGTALMGGSTAGLANALGTQGINSLLGAAGLGNVPGAGLVANVLGNQVGGALQNLFTGGLDSLTSELSNSLPELSVDNIVASTQDAIGNIDVNAIGSMGLDKAADQLMSAWKVDDESSAAEHIANNLVKKNIDELKGLAKDELFGGKGGGLDGLMKRIEKMFTGEASKAGLPAVRIGDTDDGADVSMTGIANILVEHKAVTTITGPVVGPKAPPPGKPILQGAATVLSAGLPTAFVKAAVAVPSLMEKGAMTVFVGGAIASIAPPPPKAPPTTTSNKGPAAPAGPSSASSGSGGAPADGKGAEAKSNGDDSVAGKNGAAEGNDGKAEPGGEEKKNDPATVNPGSATSPAASGLGKGSEHSQAVKANEVDSQLKQQGAAADQKAADLQAKAEQQRGLANEADAKASGLTKGAEESAHGAQNAAEYGEGARAAQEAADARNVASQLGSNADALSAEARAAAAAADGMPRGVGDLPKNAPELKVGGVAGALGTVGKYAGPAGDLLTTGVGVYNMNEYAKAGENREVVREAGGTIGNLLGGTAGAALGAVAVGAFVVGTGGVGGLLLVGAGAFAGGYALGGMGEAAGAAAGDAIADRYGIENQSGSKAPNKGVQYLDNLSSGASRLTDWW